MLVGDGGQSGGVYLQPFAIGERDNGYGADLEVVAAFIFRLIARASTDNQAPVSLWLFRVQPPLVEWRFRRLVCQTGRSEERRVGKEGDSTGRSRWSPSNSKQKINR